MKEAIIKIERRITDLDDFKVDSVHERSDPRISALELRLDTLLVDIFGTNTFEYEKHKWHVTRLDTARRNMLHRVPIEEVCTGLRHGIETAKSHLQGIKADFIEKIQDGGETGAGRALRAYEGLELHPVIERAVGSLFKDGHYANAIEDSVKALNTLVKLHSGVDDKDGTPLMEYVFSVKNPILKFNALSDESDQNEQRGFMMLLSGAVIGLRNPRAHKIIKDDPDKALEFIAFVSLLAKLVDGSHK